MTDHRHRTDTRSTTMTVKAFSLKTLLAAGALAAVIGIALPATAAKADVAVGIGVGIYPPVSAGIGWGGGYDGGYGGGYGGGYHRPRYPDYDRYVSCRDGRRILWRSGYSGIEVRSCRGGFYRYTAWRNGKQFLMAVDARGDVSRLRRIH
jgi:hypothetical protein